MRGDYVSYGPPLYLNLAGAWYSRLNNPSEIGAYWTPDIYTIDGRAYVYDILYNFQVHTNNNNGYAMTGASVRCMTR